MKLETFKKRLNQGDIRYKGFNVTMLPNWKSDGKTCLAAKSRISYKGTEEHIYELLYWYERSYERDKIIDKYFKNETNIRK